MTLWFLYYKTVISTLCSGLYLWKDSFRFRLFPTRLRLTELAESECGVLLTSVTIVNKDSIDSRLFLKSSGITYSITILEFKPPRQLGSYFPLRPLCPPREARSFRRNHRYPFYRFLAISVVQSGIKLGLRSLGRWAGNWSSWLIKKPAHLQPN